MRLLLVSPLAALALSTVALAAVALPAAAAPPAAPAAPAPPAPAGKAAPASKPLAAGQVAVKVQCRGMPDGALKDCKAIGSEPKNADAEQAAVTIASQQRGKPPANWPAEGQLLVLPLVLTPNKAGS